jgi:hypothetical protein
MEKNLEIYETFKGKFISSELISRGSILVKALLATLGPGFYSASNRNEYQKQKSNVSGM